MEERSDPEKMKENKTIFVKDPTNRLEEKRMKVKQEADTVKVFVERSALFSCGISSAHYIKYHIVETYYYLN